MATPKRSQRLQVVLQLAEQAEESARQELQQAQARLRQEQDKLAQLQQYQDEYQDNLRAQTGRQISPTQYQTLSQFISRLSVAIAEQRRHIQMVSMAADRVQVKWRQAYQKRTKMGEFIDQCRREEALEVEKREQKMLEEMTQQAAARRR